MELLCDDCGEAWDKTERDAPAETLCPGCRTVDWARELSMSEPVKPEHALDFDKLLSLLELQNDVLKKRVHPPDPATAASLRRLEGGFRARSMALWSPPPTETEPHADDGDRVTVPSPAPATVAQRPDEDPTARPLVLGATSWPLPPERRIVRMRPPPLRPPPLLRPPPRRTATVLNQPSRGAWVALDTIPAGAEDLFDRDDEASARVTPVRESAPPIPLVSRTNPPLSSAPTIPTASDPESLSPFAIDEHAPTIRGPRSRPAPAAPERRSRHLTSPLLSATILALAVVVYSGGRVHEDSASTTAALASRPSGPEVEQATSLAVSGAEAEPRSPVLVGPPMEIDPSAPSPSTSATGAPAEVAAAPARYIPPSPPKLTTSEALARQGDAALARGDSTRALELYEQVLVTNWQYLPARLSVADIQWSTGDHFAARASYARVLDEFPSYMLPERVRTRAVGTRQASAM